MNQALILAHPYFKTSSEGLRLGDSFKKNIRNNDTSLENRTPLE